MGDYRSMLKVSISSIFYLVFAQLGAQPQGRYAKLLAVGANITLEEWTEDLLARKDLPRRARLLATKLLETLQHGVVPPMKWVQQLRKVVKPPPECGRLGPGGACPWLRRYGEAANLPVPGIGEPAICPWKTLHQRTECEGYKRR